VKCPKCDYLGFETGDRCKNCGYDFSLIADAGPARIELDLELREADLPEDAGLVAAGDARLPQTASLPAPEASREASTDRTARERVSPSATRRVAGRSDVRAGGLLFTPAVDHQVDEPLIKLPPVPRPPLAVRRAPDTPRLRAMTASVRGIDAERTPPLQFEAEQGTGLEVPPVVPPRGSRVGPDAVRRPAERVTGDVSTSGARAAAAAIDHLMLGGVDVAVVYFTLRMAGLSTDQWTALPPMPLAAFLLLIKLSYFCAFTAVGGQTIGKMAAGIRVVTDDHGPLDAASALRRTLAGLVSAMLLGLGFLPALLGSDRRALHDHVARTRVIALRSA
jgi:uncharacterized RDD family membrane protein YckC